MSQCFSLVCHETKQAIWLGQGWGKMSCFYSGDREVMERLGRFLEATRGKPLMLLHDDEFEGYQLFEEPRYYELEDTVVRPPAADFTPGDPLNHVSWDKVMSDLATSIGYDMDSLIAEELKDH